MGVNGDLYKLLLVLHLVFAIGGFGAMAFNSIYLLRAKQRGGSAQGAINQANAEISRLAEYLIYAVFILGIALVSVSKTHGKEVWKFSQGWLVAAIVLYVVILGLLHGFIRPRQRQYSDLVGQVAGGSGQGVRPPGVDRLEVLEQQIGLGWAAFNLVVIAVVYLMVFRPGG
jgi:uncharacterized membrane protein